MESYDIYMSAGPACRPANYLKTSGLRIEAYPLDWQMGYSLDTVIHLFETGFKDFFTYISEEKSSPESENRRVKDTLNNITSLHHFSKKLDLKEAQEQFLLKMHKRYLTLDRRLKRKKSLMIICNRSDSQDELKSFLLRFSEIYPQLRIKLLNVRTDETMDSSTCSRQEIIINKKLSLTEFGFNDSRDPVTEKEYDWRGNRQMWDLILKDFSSKSIMIKINAMKSHDSKLISGIGKLFSYFADVYDRRINA